MDILFCWRLPKVNSVSSDENVNVNSKSQVNNDGNDTDRDSLKDLYTTRDNVYTSDKSDANRDDNYGKPKCRKGFTLWFSDILHVAIHFNGIFGAGHK